MKKWSERFMSMHLGAIILALALFGPAVDCSDISAEEPSALRGRITDVEGRPVEGARVFAYSSQDIKRPADFMSAISDRDGLFRVVLPPGRYWAAARLKKTDGYGPLMPGDRHSGEPVEIEATAGHEVDMDFIVADLGEARDALKKKAKTKEGPVKITGRIVDETGSPVRSSYAFANKNEKFSGIPGYISAWVDNEGRFTMYLPRGRYYIGGAMAFPPGQHDAMSQEITVDVDRSDVNITINSGDTR